MASASVNAGRVVAPYPVFSRDEKHRNDKDQVSVLTEPLPRGNTQMFIPLSVLDTTL